jgi:hypothetical protein
VSEQVIIKFSLRTALLTFFCILLLSTSPAGAQQPVPQAALDEVIKLLPTPRGNFVLDMATDGKRLWIATNKGPAYTDLPDPGKTWHTFYGVGGFTSDNASCSAIAFKDNLVVVSTATIRKTDEGEIPVGTGIHVSENSGETWTHYPQPKDANGDTVITFFQNRLRALPVTVDEKNISYSVAVQDNKTIWIASFAGGVRKSTDLGKTWSRVILPPTNETSIRKDKIYNFVVTPVASPTLLGTSEEHFNYRAFSVLVDHDTIWAGTADGINRSTDGGIEWDKFNAQNTAISGNFVVDMKLRPNHQMWASTGKALGNNERNGISYTTNNGLDWHRASDILADSLSNSTALVHKLAFMGDTLIYAANDEGLWRSSDNGASWATPSLIFTRSPRDVVTRKEMLSVGTLGNVLFVGTSDGLVSTIDSAGVVIPFENPWKFYGFAQPVSTAEDSTYAYPNPFQPTQEATRIRYSVRGTSNVTIEIVDFKLRLERTVISDVQRTGAEAGTEYKEIWDGIDNYGHRVPNGTYLYKVTMGEKTHWGKIVVIR